MDSVVRLVTDLRAVAYQAFVLESKTMEMGKSYRESLAFIHDSGFLKYCEAAAELVANELDDGFPTSTQVVDLGCGSGRLAQILTERGLKVLGIDISPSMIDIARQRSPNSEFICGSFLDVDYPPSGAVTSVGECFNYLFDERHEWLRIREVFQRVYECLLPGGVFLFDVATPGRLGGNQTREQFFEADDWAMIVDSREVADRLARRIVSFRRKDGAMFQRDEEKHDLRLADTRKMGRWLHSIGFKVTQSVSYGALSLPKGMVCFRAQKPDSGISID